MKKILLFFPFFIFLNLTIFTNANAGEHKYLLQPHVKTELESFMTGGFLQVYETVYDSFPTTGGYKFEDLKITLDVGNEICNTRKYYCFI